jgi:hypothetical protein
MKKILTTLICCTLAFFSHAQTNNDIYNAFKNNQYNFPPPPNLRDTVYVGEWDPTINDPELSFTGIKGGSIDPHGPVRTVTHFPGIGYSFSKKYTLKFKVKNLLSGSMFYVKVNDRTYHSNPGKSDIYIDVQDKKGFNWEISYESKIYKNELRIQRVPVVVAGVFRVPLMPLLVIYEPPHNNNSSNRTEFSQTNMYGSSTTMTVTKDQSNIISAVEFTDIEKFKALLKVEGGVLSNIPDPNAKAAGTVLQILSSDNLWGGMTSTTTKGKIKEKELSLIVESFNTSKTSTGLNEGGPGIGDIISGVQGCRFLWVINNGRFSATMLDYEKPFSITAIEIKDSIQDSNNKEMYLALSKVDPFIMHGVNFNLRSQPNRYQYIREIFGNITGNIEKTEILEKKITQLNRNTEVVYTSTVEDYKKGLFSYINLSPYDKNEKIKTEIHSKMSNQINSSSATRAEVIVQHNPGEHRIYEAFIDKIYGTYAIQDPAIAAPINPLPPKKGSKGTKASKKTASN